MPLEGPTAIVETVGIHEPGTTMPSPPLRIRWRCGLILILGLVGSLRAADDPAGRLPTPVEMAAAREDLWAEASLKQPGGPSYEFFRDLLPPLRYVNADFRVYPVVLSAPGAAVKARWVGDGSAVNARAQERPMWREVGTPIHFLVGEPGADFGDDPAQLDGPRLAEGFLPIVQIGYRRGAVTYEQEAFVPADGKLAEAGAVFVRFSVRGGLGTVRAQLDPDLVIRPGAGTLTNVRDRTILLHDDHWTWDEEEHALQAKLKPGEGAVLLVPTGSLIQPASPPNAAHYDKHRQTCVDAWKAIVNRGMNLEIPEPIVQDAWRSLVVGQFLIVSGDRMNYSVGNAYDHLYEAECGDAARSLLLFGHEGTARGMVGPLLDFYRKATQVHVAGHKLQLVAHYYGSRAMPQAVRDWEPAWGPVVDFLLKNREVGNGLMPPDNYAGDIAQPVYALASNANCWRGLLAMAAVLDDLGRHDRARTLTEEAASYRRAILRAVEQSLQRDADPPFIPNALFGVEQAYDVTTASRVGSYYDLMAPYILGSGVFGPGSERETWMIEYLRRHGGLAMGMIRSEPHQGLFDGEPGVNVLYGLRYMLPLLRRDDVGHAQAGFYGQLAQGMTRGTFVGGEGSRFFHGDRWGRSFYLPPNSASNAMFLITLRYLLIQDWDLDDDARPETLRLLYGAPSRWLEDGQVVAAERAPTPFGLVSFRAESHLARDEVMLTVEPPTRRPRSLLVRLPLPEGRTVLSARVGNVELPVGPDGAIDLTAREGIVRVLIHVSKPVRSN